jgi:hypothetical protein
MQDSLKAPYRGAVLCRLFVVIMLFCGIGIRLPKLNEYPHGDETMRQYRSAILARCYSTVFDARSTGEAAAAARANLHHEGILELPVMEMLVGFIWAHTGETFCVPRILTIAFWISASFCTYLICRRMLSPWGALAALAYMLFQPFGIFQSESFQPDSLMLLTYCAGIYLLILWNETNSLPAAAASALTIGLGALLKPTGLIIFFMVLGILVLRRHGIVRFLRSAPCWVIGSLSILPMLIYYTYGLFIAGFLHAQAQMTFAPSFLFTGYFWKGWIGRIVHVAGLAPLFLAFAGAILYAKNRDSIYLCGLWLGYIAQCLIFSFHTPTHWYYHITVLPMVAAGIGCLVDLVAQAARSFPANRKMLVALVPVLSAWLLLYSYWYVRDQPDEQPQKENFKRIAEEIGHRIGHSPKTVILDYDFGKPLQYFGRFSGDAWLSSEVQAILEQKLGQSALDARERFERFYAGSKPEYFVIRLRSEYERQKDLKQFLSSNFQILADTKDYLIVDLRAKTTH